MSAAPASVPATPFGEVGVSTDGLWQSSFRSMASPIRLQLTPDSPNPQRRHAEVRALFAEVERQCTRFDPESDLMKANAAGTGWQEVGIHCYNALQAAELAYHLTDGRFDPRVLKVLLELGYGTSLAFSTGNVQTARPRHALGPVAGEWLPRFDSDRRRVSVGPVPIDLGGIGKGLALRWAGQLLRSANCFGFLLEAGGDCVYGEGPDSGPWRLGVEDPLGGDEPVAVLQVKKGATATSSTRVRHWTAGDQQVHHLIDPSTGHPGGDGLASVTVVGRDPADAEVWTKVLFLANRDAIGDAAEEWQIAALWVDVDGVVGMSEAMRQYVMWERS